MSDLIASAKRYRADLLAEIDRIDRFMRLADDLARGAWPKAEAEPAGGPAVEAPTSRAAPEAPIQVAGPTAPTRGEDETERASSLFRGAFSDGPLRDTG